MLQSTDEDEAEKKTEEEKEELPDWEGAEDAAEDEAEANQAAFQVWDAGQTIAYSAALVQTFGSWRQVPTSVLHATMPNGFSVELMGQFVDAETRNILAAAANAFFWGVQRWCSRAQSPWCPCPTHVKC